MVCKELLELTFACAEGMVPEMMVCSQVRGLVVAELGGRRRPPEGQGGHEADADKRAKAGKEPEAVRKAGTEQECHWR